MEDIYKIEVTTEDVNGKIKKYIEEIKAKNDVQATDKVYRHYHKNLRKNIIDIKVI